MKKANYETLTGKLKDLQGDYSNHVFENAITLSDLGNVLGIKLSQDQLNQNRQLNEYGTEDVIIEIETDEDITVMLVLEVDEGEEITQIVDVDEY